MEGELYIVNVEAAVYYNGRYLMVVRGSTEDIAPGTLTPPGGKVDLTGDVQDILEETLRREVREETGVELEDGVAYVESHSFRAGPYVIVDIIFLARYRSGEPKAADEEEIAAIEWLTYDEITNDERAMVWTRETMRRAELVRRSLGW